MERVFTELTERVDVVSQDYASGMEKQEIADKYFKALCTINNQIMTAFDVLGVRNRSELSILYAKRIAIKKARVFIAKNKDAIKTTIVCVFISLICFDIVQETTSFYRRIEIAETSRMRRSKRPKGLETDPFLI
ncbi:DNA-binding response regulator [Dysgonomonas sp. 521]|uniref:response regulator transcription factor n=1 Tax=Dysgonomonas sp. 521 TaxID=2302932 RepID=UPI0013D72E8E|nr:response regulator transcription factor [Dysgonomonas sp. 521]NDV93510.1 DNA-binding response regulator [Dysgonomonas sp. 521]